MNHYRFVREGEDILNKEGTKVVNYKEVNIVASSTIDAIGKIDGRNHGKYALVDIYSLNKDWT